MEYWKDFYLDAEDACTRKKLEPLGEPLIIQVYVDAYHAGNLANRRYHSEILVFFNNSLINLYSKINNTVESSSFGSEFVALRVANDFLKSLRYNLRGFGINPESPAEVYCYNKSVVKNYIVPEY